MPIDLLADFLCGFPPASTFYLSIFYVIAHKNEPSMTKVRRIETYLSPQNAVRLTRLSRTALARYVRQAYLTHYRTAGGHRRYALSELQALYAGLKRRKTGEPEAHSR